MREMLTEEHKKSVYTQRLFNAQKQKFDSEVTLEISEAMGDPDVIKNKLKEGIAKYEKAVIYLDKKLDEIEKANKKEV